MDLKAVLGDAYRDDMTMAEVTAALAEVNLVDPAGMIDKKVYERTKTELDGFKKKEKDHMTDAEQFAAQQQELAQQLADLQKENQTMRHEKTFIAAGYDEKTASKLAGCLAEQDMDGFVKAQSAFAAAQKDALAASIKADLMKDFVPPGGAAGGGVSNPFVERARSIAKDTVNSLQARQDILKLYL